MAAAAARAVCMPDYGNVTRLAWLNPHASSSFARATREFTRGSLTPRDFLEGCAARIEEREADVRAFVTFNLHSARKAADESTKRYRSGTPLSPIDGCPVGVKDMIAMPARRHLKHFRHLRIH